MLNRKASATVTDMLTKFDDSKRAVANLMARENITCQVVDGAETAKFNPTTRVLIVPNWTGLTTEQCDLLMSHEIGHALFTDRNLDLKGVSRGLFSYYNIIEDARIERRMKGAFPGLAPTFYKGYREFHSNGPLLKGTTDALYNPKDGKLVPFAKMRLIDRINMHYKIGAFCSVPFSASDKAILARVDKCTSSADCLALAKELFKADKQSDKQDQPKGQPQPQPEKSPKTDETEQSDDQDSDDQESSEGDSQDQDTEDSDSNESDGDSTESDDTDESDEDESDKGSKGDESDEDESDEDGDGGESTDEQDAEESDEDGDSESDENDSNTSEGDSDPSAVTDTDEALKDIASKGQDPNAPRNTLTHVVYPVLTDAVMKDRVITAHDFTTKGLEALKANGATDAELDRAEAKWNAKYLATAKHMALEFERRKSAKNLQNAITGRTGKLDLSKLAGYRFTEDLFKRSITIPNGKSHGIVMLIDGSGSMSSCFAEVIDQVLLFAHFAFIVNIPFEAYMFSDNREYRRYDDTRTGKLDGEFDMVSQGVNALTLSESGRLIGLVNTTTNRAEFKKNCQVLLAVRSVYGRDYGTVSGAHAIPHSQLSGTPLFQGIMIAERIIARMKTTQKLDKTTFVVITDGEDTNGIEYETSVKPAYDPYSYRHKSTTFNVAQLDGAFVVRDAVTKKNLSFVKIEKTYGGVEVPVEPENAQLTMLLDVMKLRHDTRTVYIYLQEGRRYSYSRRRYGRSATQRKTYSVEGLSYLVRAGKQDEADKLDHNAIINTMKEDSQYVVPTTVSVADLAIILPVGSVQLTEDTFSKLDTDDMTQKKIAAEFTKAMVAAVSNRKFVNSVVPHLI